MMNILWLKCLLSIVILSGGMPIPEHMIPEPALTMFVNKLFAARAQILIDHDPESIRHYYLENIKTSQYAYHHEARRSEYLKTWASHRGIKFTKAEVKIRIIREQEQEDTAKVSLVNTMQLTYEYPGLVPAKQQFGLGTRHGITLKKVDGQWHLKSEWYSDPLDEDPAMISVYKENQSSLQPQIGQAAHKKYNRMQAVAYADKYAGDAWGAENDHKYNKKYKDYTHVGGDCTNFASQVIGDPSEGGGLQMTSNWYYRYKQGGSDAWVSTDSFKNFLVYRGYGRIIARGGFIDLFVPSSRFPHGAFAKMELGDLIAYEMKGEVDHFCILTGKDPKGYPLVNSHSSDRFHVPMDLGWDKNTKFSLIHIRD